jgi:hypothetical protein|tara:strand:+ start:133 stop:372 length:240 start_codon:yes stop_codon:yes gene_type:complete
VVTILLIPDYPITMFSRRHYQFIASILRNVRNYPVFVKTQKELADAYYFDIVRKFANEFKKDNHRFDESRFYEAINKEE